MFPRGWQLISDGNVETSARIDVYGFPAPEDILPSRPRLQRRRCERFVVDGHLGGLARNLRLLGLNSSYEPQAEDHRLLQIMSAEERAILTRDRRLLMHSIVTDGFCPRSHDPEMQTTEVLRRFGHTIFFRHNRSLHPLPRMQRTAPNQP